MFNLEETLRSFESQLAFLRSLRESCAIAEEERLNLAAALMCALADLALFAKGNGSEDGDRLHKGVIALYNADYASSVSEFHRDLWNGVLTKGTPLRAVFDTDSDAACLVHTFAGPNSLCGRSIDEFTTHSKTMLLFTAIKADNPVCKACQAKFDEAVSKS